MADWYVSSAAWTAIPQFAASGVYTVGNIVRPLTAPAFGAQYAFRCTTAGTASTEPAWPIGNNATVTTGGATFTNVSGQSTYGWSAAAGSLYALGFDAGGGASRFTVGDRAFLSSDHSETGSPANGYRLIATQTYGVIQAISVNRAGSVPPAAADTLSGAAIIYNGISFLYLDCYCNIYWQGIAFTLGGTGTGVLLANAGTKSHYFRNCAFVFTTGTTNAYLGTGGPVAATLDNTTIQFNNASQRILAGGNAAPFELRWINTPAATLGTVPTNLFVPGNSPFLITCRGVDLSAVTTTLCNTNVVSAELKSLFDSCRIASGVARTTPVSINLANDEVELVNCFDGTSFISERHTDAGDVTTEFTITLTGGATDNVGTFSHKMISGTRSDPYAMPLDGFWLDTNYATTGSAKTATVEFISSASLNNNDIWLMLEYEGTTGSSLASFVSSLPNALTAVAAVPTSTATWNSSPATPVRQHLQVTFTPRTAGRVRAQVRLGKPSTTVYYDPRVVIT